MSSSPFNRCVTGGAERSAGKWKGNQGLGLKSPSASHLHHRLSGSCVARLRSQLHLECLFRKHILSGPDCASPLPSPTHPTAGGTRTARDMSQPSGVLQEKAEKHRLRACSQIPMDRPEIRLTPHPTVAGDKFTTRSLLPALCPDHSVVP